MHPPCRWSLQLEARLLPAQLLQAETPHDVCAPSPCFLACLRVCVRACRTRSNNVSQQKAGPPRAVRTSGALWWRRSCRCCRSFAPPFPLGTAVRFLLNYLYRVPEHLNLEMGGFYPTTPQCPDLGLDMCGRLSWRISGIGDGLDTPEWVRPGHANPPSAHPFDTTPPAK